MWLQLALTGLLFAGIPLGIVKFSGETNHYRKLIAVTLVLTFELIMFGAFTRLTDSGLGCPDWPGCYGQSNPFLAHADIKAAESLAPMGPVSVSKAWIEMLHRYLATSVGVLILLQCAYAWIKRKSLGQSPMMASLLVAMVCLQGAFGAWTVTLKLQPIIVTGHLLLGLTLLMLIVFANERQKNRVPEVVTIGFQALTGFALLILFVQLALGGWVSTNYAAMACGDYPLCNGHWMPALDWSHGFSFWRALGRTANGEYLPFSALETIQWVHRSFAWFVFLVLLVTAKLAYAKPAFRRLAKWLIAFLCLQIASGIATVYFAWPLALAVLHNGGAVSLVLVLSMLNYRVWVSPRLPDRI